MKIVLIGILISITVFAQANTMKAVDKADLIPMVTNVIFPADLRLAVTSKNADEANKFFGLSDTTVVGLGAALLTLISTIAGTLLANLQSRYLLRENNAQARQLQDESNIQKNLEAEITRKFVMRQSLYQGSIGVTLEANIFFAKFLSQSDPSDIDPFFNFNKCLSEIQLVGDDETVKAAFELQRETGKCFFKLMKNREVIDYCRAKNSNSLNTVVDIEINALNTEMLKESEESRRLQAVLLWNMKRELGISTNLDALIRETEASGKLAIESLDNLMSE